MLSYRPTFMQVISRKARLKCTQILEKDSHGPGGLANTRQGLGGVFGNKRL
jgi:hypothetical protein